MSDELKLSIVTAYYNRKDLFKKTLESINKTRYVKNIELVVVDDGSDELERIEDLVDSYDFPIRVFRNEPDRS